MTVVTEISLGIALWLRRVNWVACTVGCCLHLSIVIMLKEPFALIAFALACVPLYPMFLDRTRNTGATAVSSSVAHARVSVDAA
jgi:hypothetical protein